MNFLVRETLSFIRNQIYFHHFNNEKEVYHILRQFVFICLIHILKYIFLTLLKKNLQDIH